MSRLFGINHQTTYTTRKTNHLVLDNGLFSGRLNKENIKMYRDFASELTKHGMI